MLVYLDMCCLERPFDDQPQPRIRLETEAVLALLSLESDDFRFVRSRALVLENACNPLPERAARVDQWLRQRPLWETSDPERLTLRIEWLLGSGLKGFDALHVASAEQAGADWFVTTDDRLLSVLRRMERQLSVHPRSAIESAQEGLI